MKLCLSALCAMLCLAILLFIYKSIPTHNNAHLLKEAKNLLIETTKTRDDNLKHQAIEKISLWLQRNSNNPDKKLIADALRSRANAFIMLNETNKAIHDYQESIEYEPFGSLQLIICSLEKEQNNLFILHECYTKAVTIFTNKNTPKTDIYFIIARILNGDPSAITDYKDILQSSTGKIKMAYEMEAQAFLDQATYEKIIKK